MGVFLRKRRKLHVPRWLALSVWFLALSAMAACQFGLHGWRNGDRWSRVESAFYSAFSRLGWTLGLVVITLSTRFDFGGPLGRVARIVGWIPAARLTYCSYLLHPLVLQYAIFSVREPLIFKGTTDMAQDLLCSFSLRLLSVPLGVHPRAGGHFRPLNRLVGVFRSELHESGATAVGPTRSTSAHISRFGANRRDYSALMLDNDCIQQIEELVVDVWTRRNVLSPKYAEIGGSQRLKSGSGRPRSCRSNN